LESSQKIVANAAPVQSSDAAEANVPASVSLTVGKNHQNEGEIAAEKAFVQKKG
jgi:hypothetical protein